MAEHAIEVEGVSKIFSSTFGREKIRALEDVTLSVSREEVFGLLGGNGAGKTTLVKILLDLTRATAGSTRIQGRPTSDPECRRRVGYLPEGHRFPGYLTARETLTIFGRMSGMSPEQLKKRIPELLEQLRIAPWIDVRVKKFSKGMTQRLGLASAMVHEPEILFLDEPTDGVDPVGRREIRDFLQEYAKKGATIFLNSHLLSEVELMCDRVAILRGGSVVATGTVDELTTSGTSYRLVAAGPNELIESSITSAGAELATSNGHYIFSVTDTEQLNAAIDQLRTRRVLIRELTPVRSTLEDVFVDLLKVDGTVGGKSEVQR